jgi:hypothetical protein
VLETRTCIDVANVSMSLVGARVHSTLSKERLPTQRKNDGNVRRCLIHGSAVKEAIVEQVVNLLVPVVQPNC